MWEWGKYVAEQAAAAAWAGARTGEIEPTVLDPEEWAEVDEESGDAAGVFAPIRWYDLVG